VDERANIAPGCAEDLHRRRSGVSRRSRDEEKVVFEAHWCLYPAPYQDAARITADPAYGKIVCFCERVTAGEIRDAFDSVIPPCGLEGLRRRTRVMNGRCQGFYCGADVQNLLDCHGRTDTSTPPANVGASTLQGSH